MIKAGLTEEQIQAFRSGDVNKIRQLVIREIDEWLHDELFSHHCERNAPDSKGDSKAPGTNAAKVEVGTAQITTRIDVPAQCLPKLRHDSDSNRYYAHLFDQEWTPSHENELWFVGTGIMAAKHLTAEAKTTIEIADKLLYCVGDRATERLLLCLNPSAQDLSTFYNDGKPRNQTYSEIVEIIIETLQICRRVCVAYYGHPGFFVSASYQAIRRAREMGYRAYMLPAVSSLDCLFSDIGIDPSRYGCQVLEATDMLARKRRPDISASLILYQAGCVGDPGYNSKGYDRRNVPLLANYLAEFYGVGHEVVLYEASQYKIREPRLERIRIGDLPFIRLSGTTTIYIPPVGLPPFDKDMVYNLGIAESLHNEIHGTSNEE